MYYEYFENLCKSRNIKPADVSRATGIATSTLTNWKKGKYTPKQDKLQLIANYLGTSVDYLMTGQEPSIDFLYSDENVEFLIEIQKHAQDINFVNRIQKYMDLIESDPKLVDDFIEIQKQAQAINFVKRMQKYMNLIKSDQKSVDDLIDFLYNKEKKEAD